MEKIIKISVNNYLEKNWNNENNYYIFEDEILEKDDYWYAVIRWDGSNSANVYTGNSCKIDTKTLVADIYYDLDDKLLESFSIVEYYKEE